MRALVRVRMLLILCLSVIWLSACGSNQPSWKTYEGAQNEKSFPVPKEANSSDRTTTNAAMDYVRYSLPGLKGEKPIPDPYYKEIEAWGWQEEEQNDQKEQSGSESSYTFMKEGRIIHLTLHNGYFIVMVPKEKKEAVLEIGAP
ncbi:hypothetical protein F4V43_12680 [Paenibacillus spiritus]|uniref:Lipoprotein n=1 Tax=Paenibacillus spiritus TaxID=2496557 RepID=A0A5J5G8B2_9BACL|nr:hypothetical protein [Paenibacillus spiritus]KAA9003570.1 hypothetical protein F4V43_12680 [Paenibacillus spiritus]